MWILFACISALFAGLVPIFAKAGIKNINSNLLTALRTAVVLIFATMMVTLTCGFKATDKLTSTNWLFILLSGLATGCSWLAYFAAIDKANVNKVVPIDKSSSILAILLAVVFLNDTLSVYGIAGIILFSFGTFLMIGKRATVEQNRKNELKGIILAIISAISASLTSIFAKVGLVGIDSNLATFYRTAIVLVMAIVIVLARGEYKGIRKIKLPTLTFIIISGLCTGISWFCYYAALSNGKVSVVVPIDKLSIVVTVVLAYLVFNEKLSKKAILGLFLLCGGTVLLALQYS